MIKLIVEISGNDDNTTINVHRDLVEPVTEGQIALTNDIFMAIKSEAERLSGLIREMKETLPHYNDSNIEYLQ